MPYLVPFSPIRTELYGPPDLIATLDPGDYRSFQRILDFKWFAYYKNDGSAAPNDGLTSIVEAVHDNAITQVTFALLESRPRVTAIMGGHDERRGTGVYQTVAHTAAALSAGKVLVEEGRQTFSFDDS
jgi:hypothetical protein